MAFTVTVSKRAPSATRNTCVTSCSNPVSSLMRPVSSVKVFNKQFKLIVAVNKPSENGVTRSRCLPDPGHLGPVVTLGSESVIVQVNLKLEGPGYNVSLIRAGNYPVR